MTKLKVGAIELVDHGITGSQYFQGCGTTFTQYDHVVTGAGDNPSEALNDALEQMASFATPNGLPTSIERDGQSYVNQDAYDDFDCESVLDRLCKMYKLNPNNLPTKPSATDSMLEANGYDEDATFDEEEPDRADFNSDEEWDDAVSEFQNRESEWEEKQEELLESLTEECDNYYYVSIRWRKADELDELHESQSIENGLCPGCGENLLDGPDDKLNAGDQCENCLWII